MLVYFGTTVCRFNNICLISIPVNKTPSYQFCTEILPSFSFTPLEKSLHNYNFTVAKFALYIVVFVIILVDQVFYNL